MDQLLRAASAALGVAALSAAARGDILGSNLDGPNISGTVFGAGTTSTYKAAGFMVPRGETYRLDSVTLHMDFTGPTPGPAEVSIWAGLGGPQLQFAVLQGPPQVGEGLFTFTPPGGSLSLTGGQTWWVFVRSPNDVGNFRWLSTNVSPTGLLPFGGYVFNGSSSSTLNKVRVDGVKTRQCIDFEYFPGADNRLGTADDVFIDAPSGFASQSPLTTQFLSADVAFIPQSGHIDDRNEILNDSTFGMNPGSPPNLLASVSSEIIELQFEAPVYTVTCVLGIGAGNDQISAIGSGGVLLDFAIANRAEVTLEAAEPIVALRAMALDGGSTVTLDNLCFGYLPPQCAADVSGSSDPNDPGYGTPDGTLDAADFFYFLDQFAAGNAAVADLTGSSDPNDPGYGAPDGSIDAADFFYYLDIFVAGCP